MKRYFTGILMTMLLFAVISVRAQERVEMTLSELQSYAVKNSFLTKSANLDAESAKYNTESLKAIGLPQINGSIQYNNYIYAPYSIIPAGTFGPSDFRVRFGNPHTLTVGATASQLLFDGTWLVALQASRGYEKLQNQNINKTVIDVKANVTDMYYLALVADENIKILEESKTDLMSLLNQTQGLYDAGFTEVENVEQLQLAVNALNIQISYAQEQKRFVYDMLKFQIGMTLSNELVLKDNLDSFMAASASDLLNTTFSADSDIDVQMASNTLELQHLNLKSKKAAYLPNLGAFINFQTAAYRQEFNMFDPSLPYFYGNLWGLTMNIPILSGGRRKYEVKKVEVEVRRMEEVEALARKTAEIEYRSARSELTNALENYESSKSSMTLAKNILNKSKVKFTEGLGTSFDVTERSTQLVQSQATYIQSMMRVLNARTKLAKSLNQL
ncbi:MAG: TolC family protein [Flavobacteriales bacterium]|nr:TolC family protein [Flavobacteriales bacterium]